MTKGWIDAHTHLNGDEFVEGFEEVLDKIEKAQLRKINLVGVRQKDAQRALQLVDKYEIFDCTIGLHPSELKEYSTEEIEAFTRWASDRRVVAIGEIGLDYHWHKDNINEQKTAFIRQIELANSVGKPVVVHSRDAMADTLWLIKNNRPKQGCVLHCYSGDVATALEYVNMGFMISIAGPVTFKNGQLTRDVVKHVPLENLLIETDAPYLAPVPFRGKRNDSSLVRYIGQTIAELKNIRVEELQDILWANYNRVFKRGTL